MFPNVARITPIGVIFLEYKLATKGAEMVPPMFAWLAVAKREMGIRNILPRRRRTNPWIRTHISPSRMNKGAAPKLDKLARTPMEASMRNRRNCPKELAPEDSRFRRGVCDRKSGIVVARIIVHVNLLKKDPQEGIHSGRARKRVPQDMDIRRRKRI